MSRIRTRRGTRYGSFTLYAPKSGGDHRRVWPFLMILALLLLPTFLHTKTDEQATLRSSATPRDLATRAGDASAETQTSVSLASETSASSPTVAPSTPATSSSSSISSGSSNAGNPSTPATSSTPPRTHGEPAVPRSETSASLERVVARPHHAHAHHHVAKAKRSAEARATDTATDAPAASDQTPKPMRTEIKRGRLAPPPM